MATEKRMIDRTGLTDHQLDLIEAFEANYNAIDHFLRKGLLTEKQASFTHLVNEYSRKHPGWNDADLLRRIAEVRNAIVHGKHEPYGYVAVPTTSVVQRLTVCRERLTNPARAIPTFQRTVEALSTSDSLGHVLKIIAQRNYSQFPVYDAGRFKGLVTENGITRWLANHVRTTLSLIEMEDVFIKDILSEEEGRKNYAFVARDLRVDDVSSLFSAEPLIEAVLITAAGKVSETLLGIATRWDIVQLGMRNRATRA